jgi:nucleoid-associated protein YgaU
MITGPTVGPAMLLTVLMRWPALIIVGSVAASGVIVYKELDKEFYLTDKLQAYMTKQKNAPIRTAILPDTKLQVAKIAPAVTPKPVAPVEVQVAEVKQPEPQVAAPRAGTKHSPAAAYYAIAAHSNEVARNQAMAELERAPSHAAIAAELQPASEQEPAIVPVIKPDESSGRRQESVYAHILKDRSYHRTRRYTVRPGDSLMSIVKMLHVPPARQQAMMYRLLIVNPDAFEENNPHKIYSGATLIIPTDKREGSHG